MIGNARQPIMVEGVNEESMLVELSMELPTLAYIAGQFKSHAPEDAITKELLTAFQSAATEYLDKLMRGKADIDGIHITVTL